MTEQQAYLGMDWEAADRLLKAQDTSPDPITKAGEERCNELQDPGSVEITMEEGGKPLRFGDFDGKVTVPLRDYQIHALQEAEARDPQGRGLFSPILHPKEPPGFLDEAPRPAQPEELLEVPLLRDPEPVKAPRDAPEPYPEVDPYKTNIPHRDPAGMTIAEFAAATSLRAQAPVALAVGPKNTPEVIENPAQLARKFGPNEPIDIESNESPAQQCWTAAIEMLRECSETLGEAAKEMEKVIDVH